MILLLTCEHGGNNVPVNLKYLFNNNREVLETHRGLDLGALDLFQYLKPLAEASFFSVESRLLIELNRSLHHKNLFSEFSKQLSLEEKQPLLETYKSYRNSVEKTIKKYIDKDEMVMHISVHSFTPILNQQTRNCDIGVLYDSKINLEKNYSKLIKKNILLLNKEINVRFNYPYFGKSDGFTTYLRKHFPKNYVGIELEINQKFATKNKMDVAIKNILFKSLETIFSSI